ncbi:MAG: FG-GAP-like repeat-containing protein [Gemmatimonadota bacterium]
MLTLARSSLCLCLFGAALGAQAPAAPVLNRAQRLIGAEKFAEAATLVDSVIATQPTLPRAWVLLGAARRGQGQDDAALNALQHATTLPNGSGMVAMPLFMLYAHRGEADSAFAWLPAVRRSGRDLSSLTFSSDISPLHEDARFAFLFADRAAFDPPFVESVRIIHEWRGEATGDEFGWIARGIGDVDGDSISDVVISATQNPPLGGARGKLYVYSGKGGNLLWTREGPAGAVLGIGLEAAGDVNRDGVPDVVAGAPGINTVFVFSGHDGRELLALRGDSIDGNLGAAASGIGDFDGDGHADIIASAPASSVNGEGSGQVYIFSGVDGHRLLTLAGDSAGVNFGSTVGGGHGKFFIVGASGAGRGGRVYIFDRLGQTPRFVEEADSTGAALGAMFVSVVGDVDGDGTSDIYATDFANQASGPATGRSYVYSGKTGAVINTASGTSPGEGFGIGAGRTGDVNGDGHDDLVVGSWQFYGSAWSGGRVVVLSGKDGATLMTLTGKVPGETLGFDAVGIGDVDGDGSTDFLITSAWSLVNGPRSGRVYIVSGESIKPNP